MNPVEIRVARESDAEAVLALRLILDRESEFMLLEADERSRDVEVQRRRLGLMLAAANSTVLVADVGGVLAGFLQARGGEFRRNRHVADIVLGVRQSHSRLGLARQLLETTEVWARSVGVERLELTVMAHNERAHRLYLSAGFRDEGRKRESLRVRGAPVDEIVMGKVLATPPPGSSA
jgi:RimJ/RimL family protein N-acetyltransferase